MTCLFSILFQLIFRMAGFISLFADYRYHHCRHCNGETSAVSLCWLAVVYDNNLPVIGIIQIGNYSMADRYHYLPSIRYLGYAGLGYSAFIPTQRYAQKNFIPGRDSRLGYTGSFNVEAMWLLEKQRYSL